MASQAQQQQFFNLHLSGIGYLNRIRWVEPRGNGRRAEPFLACGVSAIRGNSDHPDYTALDLRVSGKEAIEMIAQLEKDVEERRKVVISFRAGDLYPHMYARDVRDPQSRRPTGEREMACLIKGRLLLVNSITIDGERVFTRDAEGEDVGGQEEGDNPVACDEEPGAAQAVPALREARAVRPVAQPVQPREARRFAQPAREHVAAERRPVYAPARDHAEQRRADLRKTGYAAGRVVRRVARAMNS